MKAHRACSGRLLFVAHDPLPSPPRGPSTLLTHVSLCRPCVSLMCVCQGRIPVSGLFLPPPPPASEEGGRGAKICLFQGVNFTVCELYCNEKCFKNSHDFKQKEKYADSKF